MRRTPFLPVAVLFLALAVFPAAAAQAAEPFLTLLDAAPAPALAPQSDWSPQAAVPIHMDLALAREHERFTQFATEQIQRMNANIIGGKNSMQVQKDDFGLYRASYKAIAMDSLVCQVRRAESDPRYYVGTVLYKEHLLENVAQSAEACRKGTFEPVSEKASRIIYSSKRGGGWN
ncbi:MAG: hypothetical protein Q7U56_03275 [Humidesulfovibrio sp.]|nr:hypothetical protein [Desulfovibrio sp.]MDO9082288.1 hypothetical protein [Humidesulfovibrio sp.]